MTADKVRTALARACGLAGSAINWARQNNISAAYVCDVLGGRTEPGPKILAALGFERVTLYRKVAR